MWFKRDQPSRRTAKKSKPASDPMIGFAFGIIAIGVIGTIGNLSQALPFTSALGIVAGAEGVVAMCAAQSVKAATAGEKFRAARIGMWTIPALAVGANLIAAAFAAHIAWDTAFLYALAPLGTCVAAEYIAYVKRQQVQSEDGITELRRQAAAEREKRNIQAEQSADAERRENARQYKENELFYWMSRYEKKRGLAKMVAEKKVWQLIRTAALDDSDRTDRMQDQVNAFLGKWMQSTSDASNSSKWASITKGEDAKVMLERVDPVEDTKEAEAARPELHSVSGSVPAKSTPQGTVITMNVTDLSEAQQKKKYIAALWYLEEDAAQREGRPAISQAQFAARLQINPPQVTRSKNPEHGGWTREMLKTEDYEWAVQRYQEAQAS
jgi:hypothetical protein